MKKIITLLLGLIVTMGMTQNAPINFEPDGNGADFTWTVFENESNPPLEIITNPDASGANTSATVAKFTALQAGQPWAGVESAHGDTDLGPFVLDATNSTIKIMVWKSVISDVGIKLIAANGWAQPEIKVANTVVNEWEELTFDFSGIPNPPSEEGMYDQIAIFPDFDLEGREQDNIVYFDNISFHPFDDEPTDGPEVAAPAPPALAPENVVSVFSDAFTDVAGTNFNPGWGQATQVSFVDIEGNETMKYASFNYQGIEFASALNVTGMDTLHLDMWTANATSVNIFLISTGPVETAFALPITPDEWVSYDIPLSAFTGVNLEDVIQIKFDGGDGSPTLFLDNLYFFTGEVEEGTDATLSDLMVDGTTITGFSPSVLNYSVMLPEGTTDVPVVTVTTNDPEASAAITPATEIPGTTSILVTSANTEVEQTYTVAFSLETTPTEGPNNPVDFEAGGYGADWTWTVFENESNPPLEIIANPDASGANTSATVAKFTALQAGQPWAGVESAHGDTDLGPFVLDETNSIIKIMVWKTVISDVGIKLIAASGWAQPEIKVANTVVNEWEELTFDFSGIPNPPSEEGLYDQIAIFPDFDLEGREQDNIVYFDNITFNAVEDGGDATLSDLMVDGTTVEGFSPSVLDYTVVLPEGTTDVPVVTVTTNDPEASAVVTPATAIPGTTSVLVTSANSEVEKTYTVEFIVGAIPTEPEVAAPAPPALEPENVVSIFSDAFANVEGTNFDPDWGQTTVASIVEIQGNETLKYESFNYQGTEFDGSLDVSDMEYLHLDMWTADATSVNVFTISPGPVETGIALAITAGQWVSYDIPLSDFTDVDMADLIQFKFDGGDGSPTIYLDNLYFYKDPTSVLNPEETALNIYPNPIRAGNDVRLSSEVDRVEVYDLTGKLVMSSRNTALFATDGMRPGIYMIRILDYNGSVQQRKLVVK